MEADQRRREDLESEVFQKEERDLLIDCNREMNSCTVIYRNYKNNIFAFTFIK